MREYRTVKRETTEDGKVVHAITDKKLVKLTCCLCGEEAPQPYSEDTRWEKGLYAISKVCVFYRKGRSYPGSSGDYEERGFDVCPVCFEGKLVPALVALGATLETSDFDW